MIEPGAARAHELFERAATLTLEERRRFLEAQCGSDAALRMQVETLLKWDAAARPGFLEHNPAGMASAVATSREAAGTRIGAYTLLAPIGEGGFGEVWTAEQHAPVRRRVALKLVKAGMDSKEVLARFEAERQALALMDHPHVAKVFDAGQADTGRPYFVMELVPGQPITDYCDAAKLPIRQRLELFASICHAVQHAHQKGIIHRDLKPSNILVTSVDGKPVPKVIDFGIAKATSASLTERTLQTGVGQLMGTPEYMSPEQAGTSGSDVDTRTDIYSLGVILYQLLTGMLPFDSRTLRSAGYDGIVKIIRETEPPRPSTRLSALGAEPASNGNGATPKALAAHRDTDFASLQRQLRGELDWIVMKCLEKDRARRYESASGLALDVRRYLDNEPVLAGPPSRAYRMRKLIQRHRGFVVAGAAVTGALVIGLGVAASQAVRAKRSAGEARQVSEFQAKMFRGIDAGDAGQELMSDIRARFDESLARSGVPDAERAGRLAALESELARVNAADTAVEMIDRTMLKPALAAIEREFRSQPLVDAALRQTLADLHHTLGKFDDALPLQQQALAARRLRLGNEHLDTLTSISNTGRLLTSMGRFDEAMAYCQEALDSTRRTLGNEHPETLSSMNNMGALLVSMGRFDDAMPHYQEALKTRSRVLGDEHPDTSLSIANIASLLHEMGRWEEALASYRQALDGYRRVFGDDDARTLALKNNMGHLFQSMGRYDEAMAYYTEVLDARRRMRGQEHPDTLNSINNMAMLLRKMGRLDQAMEHYQQALDGNRRILGDEHVRTLQSLNGLGALLQSMGRFEEAMACFRESLQTARRVLGNEHKETLSAINNLGHVLHVMGRLEEALPYYQEALDTFRRLGGDEHPNTLTLSNNIGGILQGMGRFEDAMPYYQRVLDARRRLLGDENVSTLLSTLSMGSLLRQMDRLDEAEPYQRNALDGLRRVLGPDHAYTLNAIGSLGALLQARGLLDAALPYRREAVDGYRRVLGDTHPDTLWSIYRMGTLLQAMQQFEEAERLFLEAAASLQGLPPRHDLHALVQRSLVQLYEDCHRATPDQGHDAQAAEWRAKLEEWQATTQPSSQVPDQPEMAEEPP